MSKRAREVATGIAAASFPTPTCSASWSLVTTTGSLYYSEQAGSIPASCAGTSGS
ncbi:MAG: hypothetical protein U0W40_12050 [Acidimicrobiia bacterium]